MIRSLAIIALLIGSTLAVYWPVMTFEFVQLDDPANVSRNPHVAAGLTIDGLRWAFSPGSTRTTDYWHPLTWVSLMIDAEVYGGVKSAGFHFTSLAIHIVNAVLMFLVLRSLTGAVWRSGLVAAWFALHPMHVESVAWVTERKDVLSGMFWLLTMWSYGRYARRGGWLMYGLTLGLFVCGLMSKPMVVTLPCVLLLLDFWPLKRLAVPLRPPEGDQGTSWRDAIRTLLRLVLEKTPFFVLAAASCLVTLRHGARSAVDVPLDLRLANVVVSYVRYIGKLIWPTDMAAYYPYPGMHGAAPWPVWQVLASAAILVAVSVLALAMLRRRPYLLVGWLWFVGTMVPVIGIFQVGNQGMADRFTYIPYTGLFIMLAWGGAEIVLRWRAMTAPVALLAVASVAGCAAIAWRQVQVWRDTGALYAHALGVTEHNWMMHRFYGNYLINQKEFDDAIKEYDKGLLLNAADAEALYGRGHALLQLARAYEAIESLEQAVRIAPEHAGAHFQLGLALSKRGETTRAIEHLQRAIDLGLKDAAATECRALLQSLRGR